jgi:superfamily II DNA or RNA helicase
MPDIIIKKKNEVYIEVICEPHIKYELSEYFTFEVPEAKFMPQVRNRMWDGKIRLFSPAKGELFAGLISYLKMWAEEHEYTYEIQDNKFYGLPDDKDEMVTPEGVKLFVDKIAGGLKARDYQYKAVYQALRHYRKIILSPTGSGKSFMIYSILRFLVASQNRVLIIVPTTSLVSQLYKDFIDYGWNADQYCHKIYSGQEKLTKAPVVITTWQSIYKLPKKYFDDFTAVIGDECHTFKAKSLMSIMTKLHEAKYRIGFTGTLDGTKTHRLVLEGLFGLSDKVINTSQLMKEGHLSQLNIKILLLKHEYISFSNYQEEMEYIVTHKIRNNFIKNLVRDLSGNTLVLFNYVEKHGEPLFELINSTVGQSRKVFFVHGGTDTDEREDIRTITEAEENAIIIASYGTFSTGINIRNLHNVVFASPSKSRIRNLQSIGRVLRKGENKNQAVLYDVADDISRNNRNNYTFNHLKERIKVYNEENFNYEIIPVNLKRHG